MKKNLVKQRRIVNKSNASTPNFLHGDHESLIVPAQWVNSNDFRPTFVESEARLDGNESIPDGLHHKRREDFNFKKLRKSLDACLRHPSFSESMVPCSNGQQRKTCA